MQSKIHSIFKALPPALVLISTVASLVIFVSGFAGLAVSYAPTVPAETIASAHRHAQLSIILGGLCLVITSASAGYYLRRYRLSMICSIALTITVLLSGAVWLYS